MEQGSAEARERRGLHAQRKVIHWNRSPALAVFSLVHGGQHGAWCFDLLTRELAERGHRGLAVDLPAGDATAGAAACAEVVAKSLAGIDEPVVVVGHSLGGLTIPLVAGLRPVARLVFVCGAIPEPGRSHFEVKAEEEAEAISDGAASVWEQPGDFHLTPREFARELWYHDCPRALQDWALDRIRPQSRAPHREPCPLAAWPDVPTTLVNTSSDRCISLPVAFRTAERTLGLEPLVLPGGHCPFLSRPGELADVLSALAY